MREGETCNMMRVRGLRFDRDSPARRREHRGRYLRKPHSFSAGADGKYPVFILLLLVFSFLFGILCGFRTASRHAATVAPEIRAFLEDFTYQHVDISDHAKEFAYTLLCYLRCPLLAFLSGFASFGVVLLPLLSAAFAFSLSYSVSCFAFALGSKGVLTAASVFAFRALISVPCFFLLAYPAFTASLSLLRFTLGRTERNSAALYPPVYFYRFFVALLFLLAGSVMDPWLSARLLSLCLHT